jgi:hypothetical protein
MTPPSVLAGRSSWERLFMDSVRRLRRACGPHMDVSGVFVLSGLVQAVLLDHYGACSVV